MTLESYFRTEVEAQYTQQIKTNIATKQLSRIKLILDKQMM